MTRETFNELTRSLLEDATAEHLAKSKDYASEADVLNNFKWIAEILNNDPKEVWAVYSTKHWLAITNYCRTGEAASEDIRGRIIDAINYLTLLWGLINDTQDSPERVPDDEAARLYNDGYDAGYLRAKMEILAGSPIFHVDRPS